MGNCYYLLYFGEKLLFFILCACICTHNCIFIWESLNKDIKVYRFHFIDISWSSFVKSCALSAI